MAQYVTPEVWAEGGVLTMAEPEPEPETTGTFNATNTMAYAEPTIPMYNTDTKTTMGIIAALMGVAIIVQNLVVLYVIAKSWPKQTPTITYFIIHLACADLTAGFQFLWFNSIDVFLMITHDGMWILILCGIWMVTIAASIGGIINFAQLRIHILKSAMKNTKFSKKRAILTISLSWILPTLVLFIPPIAGWNCVNCTDVEECPRKCSQVVFPFTKSFVMVLVILMFVSIIWIIFLYVWIFVLVHKKLNAVRSISTNARNKETEKHLFNTMMFILVLFFVCHFPIGVVLALDFVTVEYHPVLIDAFQVVLTISFLNSLLNPFIYYWRMPATRDSFWIAFGQRNKTQSATIFSSNTANAYSLKNQSSFSVTDIESKRGMSERTTRISTIKKQKSLTSIDENHKNRVATTERTKL